MEKAAEKGGGGENEGMVMKKTLGRRKIPMERIEDASKLHACFSKRRKGLFKKAFELSALYRAQVGLIVFSPGGNCYTYCHGDAVLEILFGPPASYAEEAARAARQTELRDLFRQAEELTKARDAELRKGEELEVEMRAVGVQIGGDVPGWELPDLQAALGALQRFQDEAAVCAPKIYTQEAMMQQCTGGNLLDFTGSCPSYTVGNTGSHQQVAMDTTMKLMGGGAGNNLFDFPGSGFFAAHGADTYLETIDTTMMLSDSLFHYNGSGPSYMVHGAGSHEKVAMDTTMKQMGGGSGNNHINYLGSGSVSAHGAGTNPVAIDTTMMLSGSLFHYNGSGPSYMVDGAGSHEEVDMDTTMKLMGGGSGNNHINYLGSGSVSAHGAGTNPVAIDTTMMLSGSLFHYNGSGPSYMADGAGSHEEVAMDTTMKLMGGGSGNNHINYLGSGSVSAHGAGTNPVAIDTTMMLSGSLFHYNASGPFRAHGTGGTQDFTVDTNMKLRDGVGHHALAPMMPPPPPPPLPFYHAYGYNNLSAGYGYNPEGENGDDQPWPWRR